MVFSEEGNGNYNEYERIENIFEFRAFMTFRRTIWSCETFLTNETSISDYETGMVKVGNLWRVDRSPANERYIFISRIV